MSNQLYSDVDDIRGSLDFFSDPRQWRAHLRRKVFTDRGGRSDLTQIRLNSGFDLHEGIIERRWVAKQNWQEYLFAGPNVFCLRLEEHRDGGVPDRTICYWLSVARYGIETVEKWIETLPFKSPISTPWRGTHGLEIVDAIPDRWAVDPSWYQWLNRISQRIDIVA